MKKIITLFLFCSVFTTSILAQDIADVSTKARFERSKTIYLSGGMGIVQGALGDYSNGISFEAGFLKRMNKVMSIGGGLSYMAFKYDAAKTHKYYYNPDYDETIQLSLSGGDVSLLSAGFNFKLNLIPVSDDTKFSIYAIGTPFVSYYTRSDVSGNGDIYDWNSTSGKYDILYTNDVWNGDGFPALKKESKVTGGVYLGFGVELFPAKAVSIFAQATYGYTLPITFVNSSSFLHSEHINRSGGEYYQADLDPSYTWYNDTATLKRSYYNDAFPIVKKGFTALSLKLGVAFNF